jgi:putative colanic acid biosynthesis acetyltransferase WcaF
MAVFVKCFGAKIEWSSHIYASVKIWAPWNLEIGTNSSPKVDCYNQGKISWCEYGDFSKACCVLHDYNTKDFPLVLKPPKWQVGMGRQDAFIGP